ncbi:MAG: hypothetical protein B6U76_00080 [Desulfurococcales archaeon ex4484_217_2]|nr:MAG: hypothetical protein B6U76_00080 [Desulfurococcales archaeon ex4484_217_2]
MGGGKYEPQQYYVADDPYTDQPDPTEIQDLGDYTNVPQEIKDQEQTSQMPTEGPTILPTTKVGAARGLKL